MMRMPLAFLRRDFFIWSSYRLSVIWQILGVVVLMVVIYFLGTIVGNNPNIIQEESGSYLAFFLAGLAFTDFFYQGLISPSQAIRDNQRAGTLEPMLVTPISLMGLVFSASLFKFLLAFARMTTYLTFGIVLLGFWRDVHIAAAAMVFITAAAAFLALGTISAAFIMVVKQGDPVILGYAALSGLVGGMLYPVQALPSWLRPVTDLFPLTHALSGMRTALAGGGVADVTTEILALLAMSAVLLPLALLSFNWAVDRTKREGSLDQY